MKQMTPFSLSLCCLLMFGTAGAAEPTPQQEALHVLNRLGYGPRPGDLEQVMQIGVDRYIEQQLNPASIPLPDPLQKKLSALDYANRSAGDVLYAYRKILNQTKDGSESAQQERREQIGKMVEETAQARLWRAIESPRQLEEVMVDFWFNHFNVFNGKSIERALVASYERDAIRPYVLGNFRDLLGATAKHPAMLFYLDNWLSTSADYRPGSKRRAEPEAKQKANGLNENYARELMELHTLGVDGEYSQKDVTELARMLTGWTFDQRTSNQGRDLHFVFDDERHDHGSKQWLGKTIDANGKAEGELALNVLAMHPATARHLSYKLAQYFVQDQPPPDLVAKLAKRYLETRGDIRAVLQTLFVSVEFRNAGAIGAKYKTPYQFVVSAMRATASPDDNIRPLLGSMTQLGMPLYGNQTPDGYKNTEQAWLNPDALSRRINFATALATGRLPLNQPSEQSANGNDKRQLMPAVSAETLQQTLGPALSEKTRQVIASNQEALRAALMLGSPDFMQR